MINIHDTKAFNIKMHCNYGNAMEISITTISRNGQVVIPLAVRKALGIGPSEKFLVISEGETIILKRLRKEQLRKEFEALLTNFSDGAAKAGLTPEDAGREVKAHRSEKRRANEASG